MDRHWRERPRKKRRNQSTSKVSIPTKGKTFIYQEDQLYNLLAILEKENTTVTDSSNYPPQINDMVNMNCYQEFYDAVNPYKLVFQECCAICSLIVPCVAKPDVSLSNYAPCEIPNKYLLKLHIGENYPSYTYHLSECQYVGDNYNELQGLLLCKKGLIQKVSHLSVNICSLCLTDLQANKKPLFSLVNDFYIGTVPLNMPVLTWMEQLVISRVQFSNCIFKLTKTSKLPSQRGFKGHLIAKPQKPDALLTVLPRNLTTIKEEMTIVVLKSKNTNRFP